MASGRRGPQGVNQLSIILAAAAISSAPVLPAFEDPSSNSEEIVLAFPQDATQTWFVHTYGAVKPDGRRHLGEDLHAPKGSPVYAAADGVVIRKDQSPRAGYHVVIQHAHHWQTWYMHLNNDRSGTDNGRGGNGQAFAPGIEVGDFVTAGQLIAFVGDSGNAEGSEPHTHFELHRARKTVNPYPYLVAAYETARRAARQAMIEESGAS